MPRAHYWNYVSQKLSEVLSDIGVNVKMVLKRRRMTMLRETMFSFNVKSINVSVYCFGSQSEGTTTLGLHSDNDLLLSKTKINVIQDWSQWTPGTVNLLMIQDETTSPGYCLLQVLRDDVLLPVRGPVPESFVLDRSGKMLLKNSDSHEIFQDSIIHGPAHSLEGRNVYDVDIVCAYHSECWPLEAQPWLDRRGIGGWPTEETKQYSVSTGCFVVPVSSKSGQNEETEWRISTSQAERCLMFSLNITQIRCYILMKMILKTFINPRCNGVISSFMCKTVLLHCIQSTHFNEWQENNLLQCLTYCLLGLQHCIREKNCPHFIIPGNNLMLGRISASVKCQLLEILQHIIHSEGNVLLEISIDDIGMRLQQKMSFLPIEIDQALNPERLPCFISGCLQFDTGQRLSFLHRTYLRHAVCSGYDTASVGLRSSILSLIRVYSTTDGSYTNMLQKSVCELLFPLLCSSLGSIIASSDIRMNNSLSSMALAWLSAGLNSDVLSGRLKVASALYCTGDLERAELVLRNIKDLYDPDIVETTCHCSFAGPVSLREGFIRISHTGNEDMIKYSLALCVKFVPCEIHCVPKELQYEMFRSTEDEKFNRDELDFWMDWALVDSLSFIYFLEYKTYRQLQRTEAKQQALTNLGTVIDTEQNLRHRETALNLLGQCFEQENRHNDALRCYTRSLNICSRNNAAKIHICKLLNVLVNKQVAEQ